MTDVVNHERLDVLMSERFASGKGRLASSPRLARLAPSKDCLHRMVKRAK
jgi:hypothetical protein